MADYATLLRDHVTLTCRSVDRIFLQAYVPKLQCVGGVCQFPYWQKGFGIPSSAAFGKIGDAYVAEVHRWAKANGIPVRRFAKGENKEQIARPLIEAAEREGGDGKVVLIGIAQEKTPVWRSWRANGQDTLRIRTWSGDGRWPSSTTSTYPVGSRLGWGVLEDQRLRAVAGVDSAQRALLGTCAVRGDSTGLRLIRVASSVIGRLQISDRCPSRREAKMSSQMSSQKTHRGIVVGLDGSPTSTEAVGWAAREAAMRNVPLNLVHVAAPVGSRPGPALERFPVPENYEEWQKAHGKQILEDAQRVVADSTAQHAPPEVTKELLVSAPVSALIDLSKTAEMMVVGCRGHTSLERALLGSVSYGLVHHAQCPVAVVHDDDPLVLRPATAPIVVGIDFSAASELATDIAFDEASLRGVELVAVHAWTDVSIRGLPGFSWSPSEWSNQKAQAEEDLAKWLERWRVRYPDVVVRCIVVRDWPAQRLLEQSESAQLVVVGSHGRGGVGGMLLGSVSRAVIDSIRIPVIVSEPRPRTP